MRPKNSIQIAETPIIDNFEFHEKNGVINPAFLDTPNPNPNQTDYRRGGGESSVEDDYRTTRFINRHQINGGFGSIASSWVYDYGCPSSPDTFTTGTNSMSGSGNSMATTAPLHTPTFSRFNGHLSYERDLNRDHRKRSTCMSGKWCRTLLRLFIWTLIVLSILGIVISVAFIIYIEKFAIDSCCADNSANKSSAGANVGPNSFNSSNNSLNKLSPNSTEDSVNITTAYVPPVLSEKTGLVLNTTEQTVNTVFNTTLNSDNNSTVDSKLNDSTTPVWPTTTPTPKPINMDNKNLREDDKQEKEGFNGLSIQSTQSTNIISDNLTTDGFDGRVLTVNKMTLTTVPEVVNNTWTPIPIVAIMDNKQTSGQSITTTTDAIITTTIDSIPVSKSELSLTTDNNSVETTSTVSNIDSTTLSNQTSDNLSYNESNYTTNANNNQSEALINQSLTQTLNATKDDGLVGAGAQSGDNNTVAALALEEDVKSFVAINNTINTRAESSTTSKPTNPTNPAIPAITSISATTAPTNTDRADTTTENDYKDSPYNQPYNQYDG